MIGYNGIVKTVKSPSTNLLPVFGRFTLSKNGILSSLFNLSVLSFRVAYNVLALGEEADFEALNCLPALNLMRSTTLHLSTEPAFLPNACYLPFFFLCSVHSLFFQV